MRTATQRPESLRPQAATSNSPAPVHRPGTRLSRSEELRRDAWVVALVAAVAYVSAHVSLEDAFNSVQADRTTTSAAAVAVGPWSTGEGVVRAVQSVSVDGQQLRLTLSGLAPVSPTAVQCSNEAEIAPELLSRFQPGDTMILEKDGSATAVAVTDDTLARTCLSSTALPGQRVRVSH